MQTRPQQKTLKRFVDVNKVKNKILEKKRSLVKITKLYFICFLQLRSRLRVYNTFFNEFF